MKTLIKHGPVISFLVLLTGFATFIVIALAQ